MDLFGFNDDEPRIPNNINNEIDNNLLIELAIRKYRRSLSGLLIVFAMIIIVLNILVVPYFFNARLEARIQEIEMSYARVRNLPENYAMIGVEVGAETINSVVEIRSSSSSSSSSGSGFVINDDGYVITNAHVITYEKRTFLTVTTTVYPNIRCNFYNDTNNYTMDVVSYDLVLDIAIIKFKSKPATLSPVTFGDSDLLNLGEEVIAIGNAQGLGLALTVGVVSDPLKTFSDGTNAIQTDAAINPGNSGGPLFNIYAEMVGVTTFKIINTEANEGMGFAIPSNLVIDYIAQTNNSLGLDIIYTMAEAD